VNSGNKGRCQIMYYNHSTKAIDTAGCSFPRTWHRRLNRNSVSGSNELCPQYNDGYFSSQRRKLPSAISVARSGVKGKPLLFETRHLFAGLSLAASERRGEKRSVGGLTAFCLLCCRGQSRAPAGARTGKKTRVALFTFNS